MRVLIVHNRYRSSAPSGENRVVDEDANLLREQGVEVATYIRSSDEIDGYRIHEKLRLAVRPIYSHRAWLDLDLTLQQVRPDVVHLHNPFPLISPAVVHLAIRYGVPVVQSVHNFRHVCPAGTLFRNGQVCVECVGRTVAIPCVRHGCYRSSRSASGVMTAAAAVHRRTWRLIDRMLPVSHVVAEQLVLAGVPPSRITVQPNAVPDPGPPTAVGDGFAFIGRLSEEKGVRLLISAWERSGLDGQVRLIIVGDGPLRGEVVGFANRSQSVAFLGLLDPDQVGRVIDNVAGVIVPSLWFEPCPLIILEAFSRGRAVIASELAATGAVVGSSVGVRFRPTVEDLSATLRAVTQAELRSQGEAARREYLDKYTPDRRIKRMIEIYRSLAEAMT